MQSSIISNYALSLQSMTITGYDTLQIFDRQARKDASKVIGFSIKVGQFLTSTEAIKTYQSIGRLLVIAGMTAIALGMSAADLCHGFIKSCETTIAPDEIVIDELLAATVTPEDIEVIDTTIVPIVPEDTAIAHLLPVCEALDSTLWSFKQLREVARAIGMAVPRSLLARETS